MTVPGVTFHPRESWQEAHYAIAGPAMDLARVDTFAVHYTASDDLIDGDPGENADQLDDYLRSMQRYYITVRGYSVGYNFAVDWLGGVWEMRGFDIRCAANRNWNLRSIAVLCLVDGADPMTDEAVASVRKILAEANRRTGRTLNVAPHSEIGSTACPGDGIRAQIDAGMITPWRPDVQIVDPQVLVDTRLTVPIDPGVPMEVPLPDRKITAAVVHVENISKDTQADGGHLRVAGTERGLDASPGLAHTEADGVNSDTAHVRTPDGKVWVMAVLHAGEQTHVKLTLVGVERG